MSKKMNPKILFILFENSKMLILRNYKNFYLYSGEAAWSFILVEKTWFLLLEFYKKILKNFIQISGVAAWSSI